MRAMVLTRPGLPLTMQELPQRLPGSGEVRVRIAACGVCRTDLHVVDGELPNPKLPLIPGHEIVGHVDALGAGVNSFRAGQRVGIPWMGRTCGQCRYCTEGRENLCDQPLFTGYTRDGGYATEAIADARYALSLGEEGADAQVAPLLCAGLIGWRALVATGQGRKIGLYGFGAAAHIVAQVAKWQGRTVFAFVRPGDKSAKSFARRVGADWSGGSDEMPPELLDAAIVFAPIGALVPAALKVLCKGGRVVCAGIHMSDIPSFRYDDLWHERQIVSVANLTRQDGTDFLAVAQQARIAPEVTTYPLALANIALDDLRQGRLQGAAVLLV